MKILMEQDFAGERFQEFLREVGPVFLSCFVLKNINCKLATDLSYIFTRFARLQ